MHVVGKANLSARSDTQDSQSPDVSNCILGSGARVWEQLALELSQKLRIKVEMKETSEILTLPRDAPR